MDPLGCDGCFGMPDAAAAWAAVRTFPRVVDLIEESHYSVRVLACPRCGTHCVSVFAERIDWVNGEDPQSTWAMALTAAESEAIRGNPGRVGEFGAGRRCLRMEYPAGADKKQFWETGPIRVGPHD